MRVRTILVLGLNVLATVFFAGKVNAATYYVATNGSDGAVGSMASPWATLGKAAQSMRAGDVVYIRGGTYRQAATWTVSGTPTAPILISNYQSERVILDGNGISSYSMVRLSGDYITVRGLEIQNITVKGAAILIEGDYSVAEYNKIHDNWNAAIHVNGNYSTAQFNTVWNNGLVNLNNRSGVAGGWPAVVSCVRNHTNPTPHHCTLRGNTVSGNWGEGISVFEQTHATIEDNISFNNQQNIYVSDTKYTIVRRNLAYCTPGNPIDPYQTQNGILVGDELGVLINGVRQTSSDNTIVNNMIMGCDRNIGLGTVVSTNSLVAYNTFINSGGDAAQRANVWIYSAGSCTNCRFMNNLILQDPALPIAYGGNNSWTRSHNLWSNTPPSVFASSTDIIANPLLAKNGSTGAGLLTPEYFKLLGNSPAINRALVLASISDDYFKAARGSNPDRGAHEYGASGTPPPTTQPTATPTAAPVNPADANGDGLVDTRDFAVWLGNYLRTTSGGRTSGDFNRDGRVDGMDYSIWRKNVSR